MITEDYVSFEVAKLLKEKGFNELCFRLIREDEEIVEAPSRAWNGMTKKQKVEFYLCPTHQRAVKWLREKYYIHADPIKQGNYNDCSEYYTWIVARMGIIHRNSTVADKLSYKEAVEAALKYCIENLI